ncbi:hypothetical protein GCM10007079_44570 [Nocardiopsis terrae]|nr:hypothetical protein GCM10007079_44570 [Nocardiopsis terrae]
MTLTASDGRPGAVDTEGAADPAHEPDCKTWITPEEKYIRQLADFIKRGTPGKGVSGNFRRCLWSAIPGELKL